jgi:arginyl-tRNA synthetase
LAFDLYGDETALQKDPIDHLFQLYVRINREKEEEAAAIEALKKEGKDASELEAKSKDEEARRYFKRMVSQPS